MNRQRYTLPAMALHWGQAVLVVWLLWLGWTMTDLPKDTGQLLTRITNCVCPLPEQLKEKLSDTYAPMIAQCTTQ